MKLAPFTQAQGAGGMTGLQTRLGANASLRVEYVRTDDNDFIKNNAVLAGVAYHF